MNPETNRFERLYPEALTADKERQLAAALDGELTGQLVRPDGTTVPKTWTKFTLGELVVIKDYTFKVAYIGETSILFEPVGLPTIGAEDPDA